MRKAADSVADFRPGTPALSGTFTRTVPLGSATVEHNLVERLRTLRCLWYRLRPAIAEMNYATRRLA